jgi:hypothetical protein
MRKVVSGKQGGEPAPVGAGVVHGDDPAAQREPGAVRGNRSWGGHPLTPLAEVLRAWPPWGGSRRSGTDNGDILAEM